VLSFKSPLTVIVYLMESATTLFTPESRAEQGGVGQGRAVADRNESRAGRIGKDRSRDEGRGRDENEKKSMFSTTQFCHTLRDVTLQYSVVQNSTVLYSLVQSVQYCTVYCSTVQYIVV
jgi:hypothetical protein